MVSNSLLHVKILVDLIINSYFTDSRCIFVISDSLNKNDFKIDRISTVVITSDDLRDTLVFNNYGCKSVLINHENPSKIFENFEFLIKRNTERWNVRKFVILANSQDENEFVSSIFNSRAIRYVSDILAIFGKSMSTRKPKIHVVKPEFYNIWSHPYGGQNGTNNIPKIIDKWYSKNSSFLYGTNLFPNKLENQMCRIVNYGTFTYEPYSIIDLSKSHYGGTEITFIKEFSKRHNITPVFVEADTEFNWGIVYENYTGAGLFGDLVEDKVEIAFAAVYAWEHFHQFFDYTKPWIRSGISLIVPAPTLGIGWSMALNSFSPKLWTITGLSFALSSAVLFLITTFGHDHRRKKYHPSRNLLTSLSIVLRTFLYQPLPPKTVKGGLLGFVLALVLIQAVFLISGYTSGYASVMTIPKYEGAVKTVDDFVNRRLIWAGISDAYLFSIQDVNEEKYAIMRDLFVLKTNEELEAISRKSPRDFGFAFERLPYGYYAIGNFMKEDTMRQYRMMEEDLYWGYCIFLARKNSILLPSMDRLLSRVFDAGLVSYWQAHAVRTYMDTSIQRIASYYAHTGDERIVDSLKYEHVKGIFAVLGLGLSLSAIIFITEILMQNKK